MASKLVIAFICLFFAVPSFADVTTYLNGVEQSLKNIAAKAAEQYVNRCTLTNSACATECSKWACGGASSVQTGSGYTCNASYGQDPQLCGQTCGGLLRDVAKSNIYIAPDAQMSDERITEFVCSTRQMDSVFITESKNLPSWTYVGSATGAFRMYPSAMRTRENGVCEKYDPRQRPWYVAAASGPKDVVLLFDKSGSMEGNKIEQTRCAVIAIMKSLTESDYFSVVAFDSSAAVLGTAGERLQQATTSNVDNMTLIVKSTAAEGGTNFESGFTKAFSVLRNSQSGSYTTSCTKVILFLTDGVDSGSSEASLLSYIETQQSALSSRARIFTYSLGEGADITRPQKIACANGGVWAKVASNPLSEMSQYFEFLATGITNSQVRWTTPYYDAMGLGQMVTGAVPIYDRSGSTPILIGVAGADIPLSTAPGDVAGFFAELDTRGKACPTLNLTVCQMQQLRARTGYTCPNERSLSSCQSSEELEIIKTCAASGKTSSSLTVGQVICEQPTRANQAWGSNAEAMCCPQPCPGIQPATQGRIAIPIRPSCSACNVETLLVALVCLFTMLLL